MALRDLDDPAAVRAAVAELERMGEEAFLDTYHYGRAHRYRVIVDGKDYPSRAVAGVAHGYQHPRWGRLRPEEFSGGEATVGRQLRKMGFEVVRRAARYGEIPGHPPGATFADRPALSRSGVHRPLHAGICGDADGAESVLVSGGRVEDLGDEIVYPVRALGSGGLVRSELDGRPVRVVRGAAGSSPHRPTSGFRYDGLHRVADHWYDAGPDGRGTWRFRLVRAVDAAQPAAAPGAPARRSVTTQRIVRTTALANEVKALHDYRCQICGLRLETPGGPYAEGAHIRALGRPDGGPDVRENILCLCPNHHVLFDKGALVIRDDLGVLSVVTGSVVGTLRTDARHPIDPAHVAHHRARRLPGAAASD